MDLNQIWTLYRHEVRSALRERSVVLGSILVPLVMYPAMLWAGFAALSFVQGQSDRLTSRVVVLGAPEAHQPLVDTLAAHSRVTLVRWEDSPAAARDAVARGSLDAFLEFREVEGGPTSHGLPENLELVLAYNEARDRSQVTRSRVESVVDGYRSRWIDRSRRELGITDSAWSEFGVTRQDLATPQESARFILALVVPFLTLITVALAAFYPAIDATAGERERSTWETLMTVAAPRGSVAAAKYLYVATFGALGGLLNLTALALSLRWILEPLAGGSADSLIRGGIPLEAIPIIAVGTALLGLFVAAGMLVFAIFARNFKEGQSMITPFYLVIILPALFLQSPELEFSVGMAAIPVVNVAMLIREAILGSVPLLQGAVTLAVMGVCVALSILFAQWVMRREEVLLATAEGGLWNFLRRNLRPEGGQG